MVTGPSAAPERRRLRALLTRFGPHASVALGILALAVIWSVALLAGDGILASGRHALLLAAALPTVALVPLIVMVLCRQRDLARARAAAVPPTAPRGGVPAAFLLAVAGTADEIEQQPLIDRSAVDEFIDEIGADAAERMFATFLVETERRLGVLRDLSGDDRDAIGFEAHTLIGSSGTFGMMRLSLLSRELELRSATIAPDAYRAAMERLLEVYRASRHELQDYLGQVAQTWSATEN